MSKILITGGTGLLGCRIVEHLLGHGHDVTTYDIKPNRENVQFGGAGPNILEGDIADATRLARAISDHADYVVHLAAVVSDAANADPAATMRANVGGLANVLDAAARHGVKRVVWTSSAAVLGANAVYRGEKVDESYDVRPNTLYGCSKLAAESVSALHRQRGLDCVAIRPALVYGVGRLTGGAGSFNSTIRDVALGKPTVIQSLECVPWQLMYNRDFAKLVGLMLFSERTDLQPVYNIPAREILSTQEVKDILLKICPDAEIAVKSSPAWQPVPPLMDGSLAEQCFAFAADYDFEAACREMIEHFRKWEDI
ncbi:NAD(P)-dependent oxidoreductase [Sphingobium sp. JS3065]|uniref:NAD-dependent epimerase/dehydratase family protein n=1 Tax=Sphingobium sp. JS3065 TaxID=2970925 RepID=UPI0022648E3B|nr:NAD(P)-dependent oxidoreductase [Sphingobium sp. JS3065]UZW56383.1 NAD(P)-dependent oxidoreductase [Sphingobium sp. JS3065]